ncbi:MAG: T9SS type A sorting domain-containing protein, partial [Flavobacteriales bacterium]
NATFALGATETPLEDDTDNNTYLRNFEVNNDWYTLDGIGNHPAGYESLTSIGTNSFTDASDGLVLFNYYQINTASTIYGLEIGLTSTSQAGAYFFPAVWDTAFDANIQLTTPLYENQNVTELNAGHVADGKITVLFETPYSIAPGGYYIGIKMYSSNVTHMRVIDDLTVPQPGYASGIEIPQDRAYTNGNAFHIRLGLNPSIGISEVGELTGISIFPNPSTDGMLQFRAEQGGSFSIQVTDMLGREVMNTRTNGNSTIDLRGEAAGMYTVRVSDGKASTAQRIALK